MTATALPAGNPPKSYLRDVSASLIILGVSLFPKLPFDDQFLVRTSHANRLLIEPRHRPDSQWLPASLTLVKLKKAV